jgi:hypothetical protein
VLLVIEPDVAVISVLWVELTLCAVARPLLLIVATLVLEDCHVTASVISTVLPSFSVPIALYCTVSPEEVESLVGATVMDRRFATVTVTLVEPLIVPEVAVTLTVPTATPVTRPVSEAVASASSEEDQLTELVMFLVLPSL